MQRLAEEKELRARLLVEKEKQDKDMHDMAMRLEKERREKAISDLMTLEKEFIDKKIPTAASPIGRRRRWNKPQKSP